MIKKIILAATMMMAPIAANASERATIYQIQSDVNTNITYKDDKDDKDIWNIPIKTGDCEDFALLKRKLLIEAGFAPEDIKLFVVVRERDMQKKTPVITYAHVVVYIEKYDVILDIPQQFKSNIVVQNDQYSWKQYFRASKFTPFCEVRNISEGNIGNVSQRCGKKFY